MISANLSKSERRAIYKRDGYRCALCDSPQAARGEPPLVAYKGASKPPTVDRVSDDAHVGVVVTDVLCAGLLVLFCKALTVFPAGALVGMPLRNGRPMGLRVAPPAEGDKVCRVIVSAMGTEDDVVDLQPLGAAISCGRLPISAARLLQSPDGAVDVRPRHAAQHAVWRGAVGSTHGAEQFILRLCEFRRNRPQMCLVPSKLPAVVLCGLLHGLFDPVFPVHALPSSQA